jgi:hypothetical protein
MMDAMNQEMEGKNPRVIGQPVVFSMEEEPV